MKKVSEKPVAMAGDGKTEEWDGKRTIYSGMTGGTS